MRKNFILILLIASNILDVFSQPCTNVEELTRKRHQIGGSTQGHPYTMFDRHNGLSFDSTIKNIRHRIWREYDPINSKHGPVYLAYQNVCDNADVPMPADNGMDVNAVSKLAVWAKNNAFVFLIGLDRDGNFMDTTAYSGVTNFDKRNEYRNKSLYAFDVGLTGTIDANNPSWGWWIFPPAYLFANWIEEQNFLNKLQFHSRSLLFWLQTYDLMKAAYELPELKQNNRYLWANGDADRNYSECSPRNKLRKLTRDLYYYSKGFDGIVEHTKGWKKNHGLAAAFCLLNSAQILNLAGVETDFFNTWYSYIPVVGQIVRLFKEPLPRPNYSPIKWNKLGQEGVQDILFVGYHIWPWENVPQSPNNTQENDYSVYAEGPQYALYGLADCGIPAMIAQRNFYPAWTDEPFLKKNEIINIFNWLDRVKVGDNKIPSIDNSGHTTTNLLAITGLEKFNNGTSVNMARYYSDYVAIIGGNGVGINNTKPLEFDAMVEAGNIIMRNKTEHGEFYFQMLAEKGIAVDKAASNGEITHEDDDLGSFLIYAGNNGTEMNPLAVDPPYFGWSNVESTNKFWMHNTLEIESGLSQTRIYTNPEYIFKKNNPISGIKEFKLKYTFNNSYFIAYNSNGLIERNPIEIKDQDVVYYFINDYVNTYSNGLPIDGLKLNIGGNGRNTHGTYRKIDNLHIWDAPCLSVDTNRFRLTAHVGAFRGGFPSSSATAEHLTTSDSENGSRAAEIADGYITRLSVKQAVDKTIFQSVYFPQKCYDLLPVITINDKSMNFVSTTVRYSSMIDTSFEARINKKKSNPLIPDTVSHFHLNRWEGNIADSAVNPFNLPNQTNQKLYFDAGKIFLSHHSLAYMGQGYKYCPPSYSHFRNADITNGSYLIFKDTLFLSDIPVDFSWAISTRQTYSCSIKPLTTPSSTDSICIKLPDVARGIDMMAITSTEDTLAGRYDSLNNYIAFA